MARIAVDAMGGDRAPAEIVHGAVAAARAGTDVVLVGDAEQLVGLLAAAGAADEIEVVGSTQVIGMGEDPASAIRDKKDASVTVAARLVATGAADGLVSAGSTGAAMAAAVFVIGRLRGVSRPAIATLLPIGKIIVDAGANLACRPEHLAQFAVMGSLLATSHFDLAAPTVGLLNIGEEVGKGRDVEKEAYALLAALPGIEFVGNVEGRDLATERADVIVTDGFTGNVMLKTAEGASRLTMRAILEAVSGPEYQAALAQLAVPLMALRARLDPESTGGASLLGVKGNVVIAHGSSSRVAIQNAIALAAESADHHLPAEIEKRLTPTSSVV